MLSLEDFKEELRDEVKKNLPGIEISFEPSNLVDRTMSQGSSTPIEISVSGSNINEDKKFATTINNALSSLPLFYEILCNLAKD